MGIRRDFSLHDVTLRDADLGAAKAFDTVLYGYNRRQVQRYATQVEWALTDLALRQGRAKARERELNHQIAELRAELIARDRDVAINQFRPSEYLGGRMEQLLAESETLAADIIERAHAEARDIRDTARGDARRIVADADEQANRIIADARREAVELAAVRQRMHREIVAIHDTVEHMAAEPLQVAAPVDTPTSPAPAGPSEAGPATAPPGADTDDRWPITNPPRAHRTEDEQPRRTTKRERRRAKHEQRRAESA